MKTFMKFLPILLLVAAAYSRTITTKADVPGVQMTMANHPSVHAMVSQLERANPKVAEAMPYSVLLKNDTTHKILAYTIRYNFVDAAGKAGGVNHNYLNLTGKDNGVELPAGATQLITPIQSGRCCAAFGAGRFSPKAASFMLAWFAAQASVEVTLDLVLYDDGRIVGPDKGETALYLTNFMAAQQEFVSMVLSHSLDDAKKYLADANKKTGSGRLADDVRANMAEHLLATADLGKDALIAEVQRWAKYPALAIHRGDSK